MKTRFNQRFHSSNSFTAFAVGVLVTGLMFGGYEATQGDINAANMAAASAKSEIVKLDTIVVTAKRINKA